ncbi:phenylacetic acid degradation-related protein [Spirochaeta thermophila DSM 6578]|uniref:Phenylacetic acid degradation-related protein n=1 Tax=Winmispira thermophila (strain ATCC 700085 / DSM 6578 / Z-1203) TaxID=869211 RepID=G0GEX5_WINT7|nr:PaaI family thioesterase [Spirochaeta thermophila]AEJ62319.1 phenylacetic acid degradation-related protein [Spirochaeta thermophila DSM 6578]
MGDRIRNPYVGIEGYRCFGCAPHNPVGLRMSFEVEGEEVVCRWEPREELQGYYRVLHGGIQATLLDEAGSWVVFALVGTSGTTQELQVSYERPVYVDRGALTVRARLSHMEGHLAHVEGVIEDGEGRVCARGRMVYFTVPEHIARRRFFYPGREAFLEGATGDR